MAVNVPEGDGLFLDHTGHFVADAEAARDALEALGFTVTPFSAQVVPDPETGDHQLTGTGNVCVMLPEGYLEFLVHTADTALGREFKAALSARAGLHLLAFGAADAKVQHAALAGAGLPMRPLVHFSRPAETATGEVTASFTVARLEAGAMPEGRVQVCTHHTEEALWQSRWTSHRNGVQRLVAMVVSTPDVGETADRFARVTGAAPEPFGAGVTLRLARGRIDILPEDAVSGITDGPVAAGQSAFAAVRLGVADVAPFAAMAGAIRMETGEVALPFASALGRGAWIFGAV